MQQQSAGKGTAGRSVESFKRCVALPRDRNNLVTTRRNATHRIMPRRHPARDCRALDVYRERLPRPVRPAKDGTCRRRDARVTPSAPARVTRR